jgi:hypothetical protein
MMMMMMGKWSDVKTRREKGEYLLFYLFGVSSINKGKRVSQAHVYF